MKSMTKNREVQSTPSQATPGSSLPNATSTRLHGRNLILARVVWLALALLVLGLFVIAIPTRYNELQHLCLQGNCNELQLSPGDLPALKQLGLSLSFYTVYNLPLEVGYTLVSFLVAAIIFWRRSDDWMALFVSLTLVTFGATLPPVIEALVRAQPAWHFPALFVQELAPLFLGTFLYLFPNGRFVPRWTVFLALVWALWSLVRPFFISTTPFALGQIENIALVSFFGIGAFAQLYRYARVSSPIQRQQTKWVVLGLTTQAFGLVAYVGMHIIFPALNQPGLAHVLGNMISIPVCLTLPGILVPLTIGMAILRYRLWDIDLIIKRTLVYSTLTAALAIVYVGLVVLLQQILRIFTGQEQSELVTAFSTLVIAVLFQPLRRHIQANIDRRFYRRKYDASRTLVAFSSTLRREIDLTQLREQLMAVVEETMQPAHISLWLCQLDQNGKEPERMPSRRLYG